MDPCQQTSKMVLFHRRRLKLIEILSHDRAKLEHYRLVGLLCIVLGAAILSLTFKWDKVFMPSNADVLERDLSQGLDYTGRIGRRLLANGTEAHNLPIWERCDEENATGLAGLFIFLYILLILIIFIALAIVCDDFFVPSLEAISEKLKLSEDVAGATFMAAGSSAPELFTSVAGVAFETDVGVGTIVGSAVFNILIIIALTAALAGQVLHLDWRPLMRDCFCYAVSICCFIYFSWDGKFNIWEAVILLVLYILYIVLMVFNPKLMDFMGTWRCVCCKKTEVLPVVAEGGPDGKSPDGIPDQTDVERMANGGSQVQKEDSKAPKQMVSFTGGHARRLSLISQRSGLDVPHSSYFHHQRGSIMGALTNHPPRLPHDPVLPTSVLPPIRHLEREQMYAMAGEPRKSTCSEQSQELELHNHGTSSQEPYLTNSTSLLSSLSTPKSHTLSPSDYHVSDPSLNSDLQNFPRRPVAIEDQIEEERSSAESEDKGETTSKDGKEEDTNTEAEEAGEEEEEESINVCPCLPCCPRVRTYPPSRGGTGCWETMKLILRWIVFVVSFPFVVLFSWTIPDCSKEHNRKWFLLSFFMSVLWIMILSFSMVLLVGRTGCMLGIDTFVMGLVIIAIGTSVPDALSSILVARDGYGDMAVSNAIGSNVFDINLGLGLPFAITILARRSEIDLLRGEEIIAHASGLMVITPHAKFGFILLFILILCLLIFTIARFRLTKLIGISFVVMYILFLIYAFLQELVCNFNC